MKVESKTTGGFRPLAVTITLETQEEVNALFLLGDRNQTAARAVRNAGSYTLSGSLPSEETVSAVGRAFFDATRDYVKK